MAARVCNEKEFWEFESWYIWTQVVVKGLDKYFQFLRDQIL